MDDLYSILPATRVPVGDLPKIGQKAPEFPEDLASKPTVIVFLRHCGCPFSEKAFRQLRSVAGAYGKKARYYAVSHASKADTNDWLTAVGGAGSVQIVFDPAREVYGKWGLGLTGVGHVFGWTSLTSVVSLAWNEGIYNRSTKGTRWQQSGFFGIKDGKVVFAKASSTANEIPNIGEVVDGLVSGSPKASK